MPDERLQREHIAEAFEAHDLPDTSGGRQALMPDFFTGMGVAEMHFDRRDLVGNGLDRIGHTKTRMRAGGGVDENAVKASAAVADPGDEIALGIALPEFQRNTAQFFGASRQFVCDGAERFASVDLRLARAEQMKVRAV